MATLAKFYGQYRKRLSIKGFMRIVGQPYGGYGTLCIIAHGVSNRISAHRRRSRRSWRGCTHSPPTGIDGSIITCVNNAPGSGASGFGA